MRELKSEDDVTENRKNNYSKRKQNRLHNYDYSATGIYHVTVCTAGKTKILSVIETDVQSKREKVVLTPLGEIVNECVMKITEIYPRVSVVKYVIMPNHLHIMLGIDTQKTQPINQVLPAPVIGTVVQQLKSAVTKAWKSTVWQKGFYDHIIKSDTDFENVWTYIDENPEKWADDEYY